jgi:hypothetical protein
MTAGPPSGNIILRNVNKILKLVNNPGGWKITPDESGSPG